MGTWTASVEGLGFAARRFLESKLSSGERVVAAHLSRLHNVIMSAEERDNFGILPEATFFAYSYPVAALHDAQVSGKDAKIADIEFFMFGGFMYFDSDLRLQDVRALVPGETRGALRFCGPRQWKPEWTPLLSEHRWKPMSFPALRKVGVRYFCWLLPGETLPGQAEAVTSNGGFVYLFHEPTETGCLQERFDTVFALAGKPEEELSSIRGKPCPRCRVPLQWSDYDRGAYADGWDCENSEICGAAASCSGRHRWFCQACSFDICHKCHSAMWNGD